MTVDDLRLAIARKCDSARSHHGLGDGTGNRLVREPLPTDPLPERFGLYPIAPGDDRTRIGVLDFDDHGDPPLGWDAVVDAARPVIEHLRALGAEPAAFRSSGGRGVHVWLVWDDLQPAGAVRSILSSALEACGLGPGEGGLVALEVEVFPKQDSVPADAVGSCIDPPLAGRSVALDPETLDPVDDVPFLTTSPPVRADAVPPSGETETRSSGWDPDLVRSALAVIPADDYGTWVDVLRSLKGGAVRAGVDDAEARSLAEEWSRASSKHDGGAFETKWTRAFRKEIAGGGRGLGTLFWYAAKNGWERPSPPCPIVRARVVESEPRTYLVTLAGYEDRGEIAVRVEDVLSKQKWQRVIMERIDQIVPAPKPRDVNRILGEAERVPAGEDGTLVGRFRSRLVQFLEEHLHRDRAEVRAGHAWHDDAAGRSWFLWRDLWDWFRRRRHYDVDQPAALYFVRQLGGDVEELDLGDDYGRVDAWWVPIDPRATIPEPGPAPIPAGDDGAPF